MANIDFSNLQEELIVFFRNQDVISTTDRSATTTTNTFTATGGTTFTLTNTSGMRNVRYVTVGGDTKTMYRDMTPSYVAGTIAFTAAPSTSSEVVINYDKASSDRIYGDLPREDIDRLNYPRLMVKIISGATEES